MEIQEHTDLADDRIRRVKCDGLRPVCLRCHKAGFNCEGVLSVDQSRQIDDQNRFLNSTDMRLLQYFQETVTFELFGFYDIVRRRKFSAQCNFIPLRI